MINEDAARQILDNWPGPPEGEHIRPQETSLEQQMNDRRRIQQLAMKDLDAALEMLPELEAGQPNPMLRTSLLSQLEYRGRSEQADQLLAEMLEAMPNVQDASQAQGYTSLLYWVARSRPQILDEFLPAWADLKRNFPGPAISSLPSPPGVSLSPEEQGIARSLMSLYQMIPELAEKSLQQFPELARKLEGAGGLKEFVRGFRQELDRTMSGGARSPSKAQEQTAEDVEREISRLLLEAQRHTRGTFNPREVSKKLEEAVRLLEKLEGQPEQIRSYVRVAATHLQMQGELSKELMTMGWEILDEAAEQAFPRALTLKGNPTGTKTPGDLEVWLYAARCWTDFESTMKEIKTLEDDLQYSVVKKFTGWLSRSRNRSFR